MTTTGVSSTGLDPNFAAALAYLAGPFSGITILLAERTSEYVRFHAWQAIAGLGALALIALGLLASAFLALFLSPFAFTVLYRLSAGAAVAWLLLWMFCLFQAFTGKAWRMPLVGNYAARKSLVTTPGD
jgi:uncharacterized membrane protein